MKIKIKKRILLIIGLIFTMGLVSIFNTRVEAFSLRVEDSLEGVGGLDEDVYNINYVLHQDIPNDPSDFIPTLTTYSSTEEVVLETPEDRLSSVFVGWYEESDYSGSPVVVIPLGSSGDITLYAKWEIKVFTVTFLDVDSSIYEVIEVPYSGVISELPSGPSKVGYEFNSWRYSDDSEFTTETIVNTNMEVYPYYFKLITISFISFAEVYASDVIYQGTVVTEPLAPTKEGYEFIGWFTDLEAEVAFDFSKTLNEDTNLYAKWEILKYTYTFKNYDGTILKTEEIEYNSVIVPPVDPTKNSTQQYSYLFAGWDKVIPAGIKEDITFVAVYEEVINQYTYTFKNADDTIIITETVDYGSAIIAPVDPTKAGNQEFTYIFIEWSPELIEVITEDITFIAVYDEVVNKYTYVFKDDDGSIIRSLTVNYGSAIIIPANPTKVSTQQYSYSFKQWTPALVDIITEDLEFIAVYDEIVNKYTYTFKDEDGTVIIAIEADYGSEIMPPTDPVKTGTAQYSYLFVGWNLEIPASLTEDIEFYAVYLETVNKYTVTFIVDDVTYQTLNVEYGTLIEISLIPNPIKEHFEFKGWYLDDELFSFSIPVKGNLSLVAGWLDLIIKAKADVRAALVAYINDIEEPVDYLVTYIDDFVSSIDEVNYKYIENLISDGKDLLLVAEKNYNKDLLETYYNSFTETSSFLLTIHHNFIEIIDLEEDVNNLKPLRFEAEFKLDATSKVVIYGKSLFLVIEAEAKVLVDNFVAELTVAAVEDIHNNVVLARQQLLELYKTENFNTLVSLVGNLELDNYLATIELSLVTASDKASVDLIIAEAVLRVNAIKDLTTYATSLFGELTSGEKTLLTSLIAELLTTENINNELELAKTTLLNLYKDQAFAALELLANDLDLATYLTAVEALLTAATNKAAVDLIKLEETAKINAVKSLSNYFNEILSQGTELTLKALVDSIVAAPYNKLDNALSETKDKIDTINELLVYALDLFTELTTEINALLAELTIDLVEVTYANLAAELVIAKEKLQIYKLHLQLESVYQVITVIDERYYDSKTLEEIETLYNQILAAYLSGDITQQQLTDAINTLNEVKPKETYSDYKIGKNDNFELTINEAFGYAQSNAGFDKGVNLEVKRVVELTNVEEILELIKNKSLVHMFGNLTAKELHKEIKNKELYGQLQIILKDEAGNPITKEDDGEYTINLLLPKMLKNRTGIYILYIKDDVIEVFDVSKIDNWLSFKTDHLSDYYLIGDYENQEKDKLIWFLIVVLIIIVLILFMAIINSQYNNRRKLNATVLPVILAALKPNTQKTIIIALAVIIGIEIIYLIISAIAGKESPKKRFRFVRAEKPKERVNNKITSLEITAPKERQAKVLEVKEVPVAKMRQTTYNFSLRSRLHLADYEINNNYNQIKNYLMSYREVDAVMNWKQELFIVKGHLACKLRLQDKTLKVYLGVNPKKYNNKKYRIVDKSEVSTHASTPTLIIVKNKRSVKHIKKLIKHFMKDKRVKKVSEFKTTDYSLEQLERKALIKMELIKVTKELIL